MASNEVDRVAKMSKDELCDYLKCKDLDPEAVETVKQNRLSGATFLELSKEHLKELFPVVGDRIAVSKLLESLKVSSTYTGTDHSNISTPGSLTASSWVNSFDVPTEYSYRTKQSIRSGVLTKTARVEIIAALATRMVQYTRYPTPYEYQTVCKKLIQTYPNIQDPVGNGYGSFRSQLRTKFRNMRRNEKAENVDENTPPGAGAGESSGCNSGEGNHAGGSLDGDGGASPPAKRQKEDEASEDLYRNDCEYQISKDQLTREMQKKKPNISRVKELMDATYKQRREWIEYNTPSVSEVFVDFPSLKHGKLLRHEFRKMVGCKKTEDLLKDWPLWVKRVFAFAGVESRSRPAIKQLLLQHETAKAHFTNQDDLDGVYFLLLLSALLAAKNAGKGKILYQFQDTVDIENEVGKIKENAPYLIMLTSDEGYQFNVVVERNILPESGNLTTAVLDLFSCYYTFNIMYPRPFYATMIFIQHFIFGITDKQTVPNLANMVYSSLVKVSV